MINSPTDHLFYDPPVSMLQLHTPELVEEVFSLPLPYGKAELKHWYFDGIRIKYTKNHFNDHYLFENKNDLNVVGLEFNLKGSYVIHHVGQVYYTKSQQHNIVYSPGVHNTFQNQSLVGETFKIQFFPDVFLRIIEDGNDILKRFADKMLQGKPVVISKESGLLNPDLMKAINDILNCRYTGGLKKIFLLSKSMEILVMQAEAFDRAAKAEGVYCKRKDDKERLDYAREYLIQHMQTPPSLSELSKIVGINEYKLKRGFKEVFDTTVFGYLSDYRLEMAKQSLLDSQQSISEVAYQFGYSSPQHFSHAFKKKFGISPKSAKN